MTSFRLFRYARALALVAVLPLSFAACTGGSGTPAAPVQIPTTTPATALIRAIHGSPDAGNVDIYVYTGTRPTTPTIAGASYPQITNYLSVPAGTYTIDVLTAGAASTATAVATESLVVSGSSTYSVVVGGTVAAKTLRFVNFAEPAETAGQSALIVHHASPFVQNALGGPVSVGVYDASMAVPATATTLFSFSLSSGISGPAASGNVSGGEFFVTPLPAGLPAAVGFAAGGPASATTFTTQVTSTASGLAAGLTNATANETTLAGDTTNAVPAGAHLSVFAVDTTTGAQLIGTLDP